MFNQVLVGVDGREGGRDAIALARQLASPEAHITFAHLCTDDLIGGRGSALAMKSEYEESRQMLALERLDASVEGDLEVRQAGSAGRGLHELAEELRADLLVVGSSRRGFLGRVLIGDDMLASLNGAPCAVAIAPRGYANAPGELVTIGVGYDGSAESEQALAAARNVAARHGAAIRAMSVVSLKVLHGEPIPDNWPEVVKQLIDDEVRRFDTVEDVSGDASYGEPGEELARFGQEVDLLAVGSRGYGPLQRLLHGSASNYLARHARCPLLVLPRGTEDSRGQHQSTKRASREAAAAS